MIHISEETSLVLKKKIKNIKALIVEKVFISRMLFVCVMKMTECIFADDAFF